MKAARQVSSWPCEFYRPEVAEVTRGPLVTRSDDRAWGATVFAGTRVPVNTMFDYLEAGETLDEFLRQFPSVTREQAIAVLEAAKSQAEEQALVK